MCTYYTNIFQNLFQRLGGAPASQTEPVLQPQAAPVDQTLHPIHPRVSLIVFDPLLPDDHAELHRIVADTAFFGEPVELRVYGLKWKLE